MKPKPRILFAEDHLVVYEGISRMLAREYECIGPITDGGKVLHGVRDTEPDLLVLDLDLPNRRGSDLLPALRTAHPRLPVLVLTVQTSPEVMEDVIRLGATGFVPKGAGVKELRVAIQDLLAGKVHRSPRVKRARWQREPHPHDETIAEFDERRERVFRLIGEGRGTVEVAQLIGVSRWTIYYHRRAIRKLLHIASERGLDRAAMQWVMRQQSIKEMKKKKK